MLSSAANMVTLIARNPAYQRLRSFARVGPPQKTRLLVYLKADPKEIGLVPGSTWDMGWPPRHG